MRQLKSFMKQRKRGRCKCLALNRWRCWDFCTCANECWEIESNSTEGNNIIEPVIPDNWTEPSPDLTDGDNNETWEEEEWEEESNSNEELDEEPEIISLDELNS